MESLYRKYRPQTFEQVVGQQHVVSTLENAVLEGRTSHAYLFCGPRGTGKTTMARILAKALMCEQGPGHLPDGTCEQCKLIAAGEHPDVYELDAASRTGVDNVREEIINRVSFAPVRGNYKFYIIDEVHMLTTAAFNALLKTLEEPPEHVVFVLCTTDPQKIPETILSRVQRFDFRPIGNEDIEVHLEDVCRQEGFEFDKAALDLVVRHARGGMRDALSTLEKLSVFGDGKISLDAAQDLLGEVSGSMLVNVACAMAERNVPSLFGAVGDLVSSGRDLLEFTRELAGHLRDVYVVAAVGAKPGVVDATDEELQNLRDEALAFGSVDRVSHALVVLNDAAKEMRTATDQRLVLEIALTRVARPKSDLTLDSLADRVSQLERRVAELMVGGVPAGAGAAAPVRPAAAQAPAAERQASARQAAPARAAAPTPAPAPARPAEPVRREEPAPAAQAAPKPEPAPAPQPVAKPAPASAPQQARPVAPAPAPKLQSAPTPRPTRAPEPAPAPAQQSAASAAASPSPQNAAVTDGGELQRMWKRVVEELVRRDPPRGSLLLNATPISDDGTRLLVNLPKGSSFAVKMLERPDVSSVVDPVVSAVFGRRQVVYAEASLRGADIARAQRGARSAQAPSAAPAPVRPAPAPAPRQAPASQPAPAPQQAAGPMPWDDVPPYEEVPYDDAAAVSYDEDVQEGLASGGHPAYSRPAPQPQAPASQAAPAPRPVPVPQPAPQPAPAPAPQPVAAPTPAPAPKPEQKPAPAPAPKPAPAAEASLEDAPEDAQKVLDMLSSVFGDVKYAGVEKAQDK
jgi:DNA polymerase-3 subunit gamma/tau